MPAEPSADYGPREFAAATGVSRETLDRLSRYQEMLVEWNTVHNLVSRSSLADSWRRHFLDSAQLARFVPDSAKSLVDLGSGAGFPGLVLAELFRDRPEFRTVLYEATGKKARFLEAVVKELGLKTAVRQLRIEEAGAEAFDVITARALAPLSQLLAYSQRFFGRGSIALLLKGRNLEAELTEAHKSWKIDYRQHPSISDPSGVILEVRELKSVKRSQSRS